MPKVTQSYQTREKPKFFHKPLKGANIVVRFSNGFTINAPLHEHPEDDTASRVVYRGYEIVVRMHKVPAPDCDPENPTFLKTGQPVCTIDGVPHSEFSVIYPGKRTKSRFASH